MATMAKLTESTLRFQFFNFNSQAQSHQQLADAARERLVDLKARAREAGLSRLFRELENPPVIPPRVEEVTVRVRVREGFVGGQYHGLPYDFPLTGAVVDAPKGYVALNPHRFESVPADTPLSSPALPAAWPSAGAPAPSPFRGLLG